MSEKIIYTVRDNDTLSKIATANNTSVAELASVNHISDPNKISVGQRLIIPTRQEDSADSTSDDSDWGALQIRFVDALNLDLSGLSVTIDNGVCKPFDLVTDATGLLPAFAVHPDDPPVKISVARIAGGTKEIVSIQPTSASQMATLVSPKVAVSSPLRKHEGPPTPKQIPAAPKALGQETSTRSANGHPVHEVALECPNPQNIKLGPNYQFRDHVIAAAKRGNMAPQAIAAIIDAEAGTIPIRYVFDPILDLSTGQAKLDKRGKPMVKKRVDPTWRQGEWNTQAASTSSSARGLTQFLDATWIDLALTEDTHLNARVRREGWLTTTTIYEEKIKYVKEGKKKTKVVDRIPKDVQAFKASDNDLVVAAPKQTLARTLYRSHVSAAATANGENLQKLLDLRFDAEYAIHAAVDYGMQNIRRLKEEGYKIDSLNDADKAKVFYMAHHLGLTDAVAFIEGSIPEDRAMRLLEAQVGEKSAEKWTTMDGNDGKYTLGHRAWLDKFVEDHIKPVDHFCNPAAAPSPRSLLAIADSLRKTS